mmetsp:Transcript_5258/g.13241  ORF Transcript_5258/g.13241 Transcript_5258/m.13241 type:complete len:274 (-) Transcript_5258:749-1570(-)
MSSEEDVAAGACISAVLTNAVSEVEVKGSCCGRLVSSFTGDLSWTIESTRLGLTPSSKLLPLSVRTTLVIEALSPSFASGREPIFPILGFESPELFAVGCEFSRPIASTTELICSRLELDSSELFGVGCECASSTESIIPRLEFELSGLFAIGCEFVISMATRTSETESIILRLEFESPGLFFVGCEFSPSSSDRLAPWSTFGSACALISSVELAVSAIGVGVIDSSLGLCKSVWAILTIPKQIKQYTMVAQVLRCCCCCCCCLWVAEEDGDS